jgi:hypothetical protein
MTTRDNGTSARPECYGRKYERGPFVFQIRPYVSMVFGAHLVLYSQDADADRRFLAEILDVRSIDAGRGWLIFEMPPAEVAGIRPRRQEPSCIRCATTLALKSKHSARVAC